MMNKDGRFVHFHSVNFETRMKDENFGLFGFHESDIFVFSLHFERTKIWDFIFKLFLVFGFRTFLFSWPFGIFGFRTFIFSLPYGIFSFRTFIFSWPYGVFENRFIFVKQFSRKAKIYIFAHPLTEIFESIRELGLINKTPTKITKHKRK